MTIFLAIPAHCQDAASVGPASLATLVESMNLGMSFQDYIELRPGTRPTDFERLGPSGDSRPGEGSYVETIGDPSDFGKAVSNSSHARFKDEKLTALYHVAVGPVLPVFALRDQVLRAASIKFGLEAKAFLQETNSGDSNRPGLRPMLRWSDENSVFLFNCSPPEPSREDTVPFSSFLSFRFGNDDPALSSTNPVQENEEQVLRALEECGLADTLRKIGIKVAVQPVLPEE